MLVRQKFMMKMKYMIIDGQKQKELIKEFPDELIRGYKTQHRFNQKIDYQTMPYRDRNIIE